MSKSFSHYNAILVTLIFFALLARQVNTPDCNEKNSQEKNWLLAEQFLIPVCPMKPINKPLHSMLHYNDSGIRFQYDPKFKEFFNMSSEANKKRIELITNLREQATLAGKALRDQLSLFTPYQVLFNHSVRNLKIENTAVQQQANAYFDYLISLYAFANISQRAQIGNCHEFSVVTLTQCHRYFFERKLPMPNVGLLEFYSNSSHNGHVTPVFGLSAKENKNIFQRDRLVKLMIEMNAVVADSWNKNATVLADDICQMDTTHVYSPALRDEKEYASIAKAFYNSFCDKIRYITLPPLPDFIETKQRIAFESCIQYILNETRVATCQPDQALLAKISPKL